MSKGLNRARRYAGCIFSTLGILLIAFGLTTYLNGPINTGTAPWEYRGNSTKSVDPSAFEKESYMVIFPDAPELILQVQTNVSLNLGQGIKAYFVNETQYSQLKNGTGFSKEIEELIVNPVSFSFEPRSNVTYYVILANVSNETATGSIHFRTLYMFQAFDFSYAFNGLNLALIGGAMFAGSFALGNLIDRFLRKSLKAPIFPEVRRYSSEYEGDTTLPWTMLGIITILILVVILPKLNDLSRGDLPPLLIPLAQDTLIRYGLFVFFASSLVFAIYVVVVLFLGNIISNFLYWCFGVRYDRRVADKRNWRSAALKLQEKSLKQWLKELRSPLSLAAYAVIGILSVGTYLYTENILGVLIAVVVPLTLLLAYCVFVSYRKTCRSEEELEQMRFFDYVNIVSVIFCGGLFLVLWIFSFDLFLDRIFAKTVGASVLVSLAPTISEAFSGYLFDIVNNFSILRSTLTILFEGVMIGAFSLFLYLSYFHYSSKTHVAKRKILFMQSGIFFATFISVQFILLLIQQNTTISIVTSLAVALATSFLDFFMQTSWRQIIAPPRLCPSCKRDFQSFSEDISHCPYCGKEIVSNQK
jgi:hypothetical protein